MKFNLNIEDSDGLEYKADISKNVTGDYTLFIEEELADSEGKKSFYTVWKDYYDTFEKAISKLLEFERDRSRR